MNKFIRKNSIAPLCACGCGQFVTQNQNHKKWNKFIHNHENNLRKQKAQKNFINKAKNIFPQYDFSKFNYINSKTKSIVICLDHGEFKAVPNNILNNHGCPKCKASKAIKLAKKDFFNNTVKDFPDYDFSEFEYIESKIKSTVICNIHGLFSMSPGALKAGKGCPICGIEKSAGWNHIAKYQKSSAGKEPGIFYRLLFTHNLSKIKFIKIGITNRMLEQRYINKVYKDFNYEIISIWHGTNLECAIKEREYKRANKSKRFYIPDDIIFPGRTECYEYDKDQQLYVSGIKFLRESLIIKQNGICPICKRKLVNPVLDHHHIKRIKGTGKCRGVLCATCNIFLGKIENNSIRYCISQKDLSQALRNLAKLLEEKPTKYIHPNERPKPKKLGKRNFNRICKYYFEMFPGRRKLPEYPKRGKTNKELEGMLEKANKLHIEGKK